MEQRTVHDEAELTRASAEGWIPDQETVARHLQIDRLAYHEQQRRNHQAASGRRDELLEQTLTKLLSHLEETPRKEPHDPLNEQALRRAERQRVVLPVFEALGDDWNPTRWALEAGVGPAVAINYLSGITKKLQSVKHDRLTKALNDPLKAKGLPPIVLPE